MYVSPSRINLNLFNFLSDDSASVDATSTVHFDAWTHLCITTIDAGTEGAKNMTLWVNGEEARMSEYLFDSVLDLIAN